MDGLTIPVTAPPLGHVASHSRSLHRRPRVAVGPLDMPGGSTAADRTKARDHINAVADHQRGAADHAAHPRGGCELRARGGLATTTRP